MLRPAQCLCDQIEGPCPACRAAAVQVIETPGDQRWRDFCAQLHAPVFLLAHSEFADLEQT